MKKHRESRARHPIIRILVIWVIQALALLILTFFLKGLSADSLGVALAAAAVIGLLNALLWPLLSYVLLPLAVLTLGLLTLTTAGGAALGYGLRARQDRLGFGGLSLARAEKTVKVIESQTSKPAIEGKKAPPKVAGDA